MQLRDMEEEAKRVAAQQQRDLELQQMESERNQERIEEIRMKECLSPRKLEAQLEAGADSKLLAANSSKYAAALEKVEAAKAACVDAEARLADVRQQLLDVRGMRKGARSQRLGSVFDAHRRRSTIRSAKGAARDQLKSLENRVAYELSRFSEDALTAKSIRSELDALLVAQSSFVKTYSERENELLEKKKQMAFVMEVCSLVYEDREQHVKDLQEIMEWGKEENEKYENAFRELNAVLETNAKVQKANEANLEEMKTSLKETRRERIALERDNESRQEAMAQRRARMRKSRDDGSAEAYSPDYNAKYRASMHLDEHDLLDEDMDVVERQIREFDGFYERLSAIADSDNVEKVVNYLNSSAEDRFRCFNEINLVEDEIKKLEAERRALLLESAANAPETASNTESRAREARMLSAKATLAGLKRHLDEQALVKEQNNEMLRVLIDQTTKMFRALGCSKDALRQLTGLDRVIPQTLTAALGFVDQRVDEYLVAYSRQQQSSSAIRQLDPNQVFSAAKTILRRPDLPARRAVSAPQVVRERGLPRSGGTADVEGEDVPLSHEQMLELVEHRQKH